MYKYIILLSFQVFIFSCKNRSTVETTEYNKETTSMSVSSTNYTVDNSENGSVSSRNRTELTNSSLNNSTSSSYTGGNLYGGYNEYNYDVSGSDISGNSVNGNVDMQGKYGTGSIRNESGDDIEIDVEWTGKGTLEGTDDSGNYYDLEVDN